MIKVVYHCADLHIRLYKRHDEFTREIIHLVPNKKLLTYYETKYQFIYGVLESSEWLNTNILAKFYSKDFA